MSVILTPAKPRSYVNHSRSRIVKRNMERPITVSEVLLAAGCGPYPYRFVHVTMRAGGHR
jgi:hypothetical protein